MLSVYTWLFINRIFSLDQNFIETFHKFYRNDQHDVTIFFLLVFYRLAVSCACAPLLITFYTDVKCLYLAIHKQNI